MKHILFILILFLSTLTVSAQQAVKGTIVDSGTGQPLPGATIKSEGKTAVSTSEGNFTIDLPPGNHQLKITYLNYKLKDTLIQVPLKTELLIGLESTMQQLQTVEVSTGYQVLPRERSTGSFVKVTNATLNEQVSTDIISRLEGVASSLTIDRKSNGGGGYGIMIRGLSTIKGPREPLIVLDNFPYEGDLNNINPNDVESITLLKDAAAASIWGARAGNGVIVITTKQAKFNQKLKVAFNSNVQVAERPDLYYQPKMSVSSYIDVENMLFDKGFYTSAENSNGKTPLTDVVELRIAARDGQISAQEATDRINTLRQYDLRDQMNKYVYQDAVSQQYSLQLSGGTQKQKWLLSGGYDGNVSSLDEKANRYNLRFEKTQKLTPRLTASGKIYLTHSANSSGKTGLPDLTAGGPLPLYTRIADDNGNPLPVIKTYRLKYTQTAGNGKLLDWSYYPLEDYKYVDAETKLNNVLATFSADYRILDGLKATVSYQYQQQEQNSTTLNTQESYTVRNIVNQFSQIDASGNLKRIVPYGSIKDMSNSLLTGYNARAQADFNRDFGKHAISAIAGAEIRSNTLNSNTSRLYGIQEATLTTSLVDYVNPYRNFVTNSNTYIANKDGLREHTDRYVSLFANAAYTYDTRYTLSLSARRDASNLYGLNTNDKWNPLFSAGASWNISNEDFFRNDAIPYLKLRATYGASGNTDPAMVAITTISYLSIGVHTQSPYASFSNYYNPELKWERTYMFNAGLDFGLKNNRLSGSIEYYRKRSVDLIGSAFIDPTAGIGAKINKNVSEMEGKGLDIELNSVNVRGKFTWQSSFFINLYKDKVLKNNLSSLSGSLFIEGNVTAAALEGKSVYSIFSYKWAGLDPQTGDPQGLINGNISKSYSDIMYGVEVSDLVYHGTALPIYSGALGNSFSYGGFSLSFRLSYKLGYYFRKPTINYSTLFSTRDGHGDFEKRWQKPGDELTTNVPSMTYPANVDRDSFYAGSEVNVAKGDHIRLQYINLAYDLKLKKGNKFMLSGVQFFTVANNIGILWRANKDHIDPDYADLPASKSISVGLRANF